MRFRNHSHLGWYALEMLGQISLPSVTRSVVEDDRKKRVAREIMRERTVARARELAKKLHERSHRGRAGGKTEAMRVAIDEARDFECPAGSNLLITGSPEHREYDGQDSLWWLSFADDESCAGVAIVRVSGEQSAERAAEEAGRLGIAPLGHWQIAAIQVPEEERAQAQPYAGRFLTTTEATEVFQAQSIKSFEAETGREVDCSEIGVVEP
jgi:hypothetical protein